MNLRYLINSDGALLKKPLSNKSIFVLKLDLLSNILRKPKKGSETNKIKKLELFKTRFLKS